MKRKRKILLILCMLVMILALPMQAQAAKSKIRISGASKPATIKQGSYFNMKGKITSNKTIKTVSCAIYNSTGKKLLQRFRAHPYTLTYDLRSADPYLLFDRLSVGTYYYKVFVYDISGYRKRVVSKKFTVIGDGKIKIVNPKPSGNLTMNEGKTYSIGGKITSTYPLGSVTAKIIDSSNAAVYSATVKPKTQEYSLANTALDNAMLFNKLKPGTYKYEVVAVDTKGTSVRLIYRTVTINGTSLGTEQEPETDSNVNTGPGSIGSGTVVNSGDYLNTTDLVVVPVGFVKRTERPAATNEYYYNKKYNIYYGYNSLAPTRKKMSDKKNYVVGNCTWYACGRALEIVAEAGGDINKVKAIFGPDPVGIYNMNIAKGSFEYGMTPKIGALAVFNYGAGGEAHIAVVEDIIGGVPYVSESGYAISTKRPKASTVIFEYQSIYNWAAGRSLKGYIYLI